MCRLVIHFPETKHNLRLTRLVVVVDVESSDPGDRTQLLMAPLQPLDFQDLCFETDT